MAIKVHKHSPQVETLRVVFCKSSKLSWPRDIVCTGCSHLVCDLGGGVSWLHTGPAVEWNDKKEDDAANHTISIFKNTDQHDLWLKLVTYRVYR